MCWNYNCKCTKKFTFVSFQLFIDKAEFDESTSVPLYCVITYNYSWRLDTRIPFLYHDFDKPCCLLYRTNNSLTPECDNRKCKRNCYVFKYSNGCFRTIQYDWKTFEYFREFRTNLALTFDFKFRSLRLSAFKAHLFLYVCSVQSFRRY